MTPRPDDWTKEEIQGFWRHRVAPQFPDSPVREPDPLHLGFLRLLAERGLFAEDGGPAPA